MPLTPDKVTAITTLFRQRLSRVETQDVDTRSTRNYLNRLMADAIGNISKKTAINENEPVQL